MHKTESAKSRGLRDNVGYNAWIAWVAWVKFLCGLRGSKYFLCGSTFYEGHFFMWVAWVKIFPVGQVLCGSKFCT